MCAADNYLSRDLQWYFNHYADSPAPSNGRRIQNNSDRPLAAALNFCPGWLDPRPAALQAQVAAVVQAITQALGMSAAQLPFFRSPATGAALVSRTTTADPPPPSTAWLTIDQPAVLSDGSAPPVTVRAANPARGSGVSALQVTTPAVLAAARAQLGCSTLAGAELESVSTYAGSARWAQRVYYGEAMTAGLPQGAGAYSALTLALLNDTGWCEEREERREK